MTRWSTHKKFNITAHDKAVDRKNGEKMRGHRYAKHIMDAIHKKYHITPHDKAVDRRNLMKWVKSKR